MMIERVMWVGFAALALGGCDHRYIESRGGSGTSETRTVSGFDSIELDGDARLEIRVGDAVAVSLRGQPAVINRTQTSVEGNTLYIVAKRKDWSWGKDRERLTVQISVPRLRSLELDGGNDVRLQGFNGGDSIINVRGAARIRASGELDQLTVHLSGAGHADLSRLTVQDAKVIVDGVGSVLVHPKQSLDATMNGVGAILYSGNPRQVSSSMNGLGTISKRDKDDADDRPRRSRRGDADSDADADADADEDAGSDVTL